MTARIDAVVESQAVQFGIAGGAVQEDLDGLEDTRDALDLALHPEPSLEDSVGHLEAAVEQIERRVTVGAAFAISLADRRLSHNDSARLEPNLDRLLVEADAGAPGANHLAQASEQGGLLLAQATDEGRHIFAQRAAGRWCLAHREGGGQRPQSTYSKTANPSTRAVRPAMRHTASNRPTISWMKP